MPLYFGSTKINDGDPLLMGTRQCTKVMRGNTQVWINNYVADAPTSFTASNDTVATINFTWVLPTDQGVPACTYSVRNASNVEIATAGVGTTTATYVTTASLNENFTVVAVNVAGESVASNSDNGSSYAGAASPVTITADGTYTAGIDFPADVELTICMCGGGGSGAKEANYNYYSGGGHQGQILSDQKVTLVPDDVITVDIGVGGVPASGGGGGNGFAGGPTVFGAYLTATGGAGGIWNSSSYAGNGGSFVSPCDGQTYNDGSSYVGEGLTLGGQAGAWGSGGNGNYGAGGAGGVGAGGGSTGKSEDGHPSGGGGRGQIVVSW